MRLFTAIDLNEEIRTRLERLISNLRKETLLKWSPIDNLHVTTKFIGEWPEDRVQEICDAMASIARRRPFSVEVKGFGWFPHDRAPRVFWCGIEASKELEALAWDIDTALTPLGIKREDRKYTPHLTLARISHPVPLGRLRERAVELKNAHVGSLPVTAVHLYQSQPGSNGSRYRKLHSIAFDTFAFESRATAGQGA